MLVGHVPHGPMLVGRVPHGLMLVCRVPHGPIGAPCAMASAQWLIDAPGGDWPLGILAYICFMITEIELRTASLHHAPSHCLTAPCTVYAAVLSIVTVCRWSTLKYMYYSRALWSRKFYPMWKGAHLVSEVMCCAFIDPECIARADSILTTELRGVHLNGFLVLLKIFLLVYALFCLTIDYLFVIVILWTSIFVLATIMSYFFYYYIHCMLQLFWLYSHEFSVWPFSRMRLKCDHFI